MIQSFKRRDFLKFSAAAALPGALSARSASAAAVPGALSARSASAAPVPGALSAQWEADAMARIEGKAVFYTTLTALRPILDAFQKASGIQGVASQIAGPRSLTSLLARATAGELNADVLQAPLPMLDQLKDEGILTPYLSPSTQGYPGWATQDDTITLFGVDCIACLYNPHRLEPDEAPDTWHKLADPKWQAQIVMANPAHHAATITWLVGLHDRVFQSDAAWQQFLKALAANQPLFVDTFEATLAPIQNGHRRIAIAPTRFIVTQAPAALAWAPRAGPLPGKALAIAIAAMAPHPAAARAFMDYWLSAQAMSLLARDSGLHVLAPGAISPIAGLSQVQVQTVRDLSDDERARWGQEFAGIFGTH